jgi:hypothetical protein
MTMSFRYRLLVLVGLLAVGTASAAHAQRGALRVKRPPYGYFKYRIPRVGPALDSRIRLRDDIRLRALERSLDRSDRVRDRQFALQERVRDRQLAQLDRVRVQRFELQDRAWKRQLEGRERSLNRMYERMDRMQKLRPFAFRRHSRTI